MESEQIANILADTREYIEEHGWVRGTLVTAAGRVCVMGGVGMSQGWINEDQMIWQNKLTAVNEVLLPVWQVLHPSEKPMVTTVPSLPPLSMASTAVVQWNDRMAKDEQAVLDVLAKAEKVVRAGFNPDA